MRNDILEALQTWLRRLLLVTLLLVLALTVWAAWRGDLTAGGAATSLGRLTGVTWLPRWQAALVVGHRGFDSGAICEDGLTELEVNEAVARLAAAQLRGRGVYVRLLDEYAPALDGLQADALVSIHADSCVELSGFKVAGATETVIPAADARLRACIEQHYAAITGLKLHPDTVTEDMTGYHAFQRAADDTPGAIIEIGFLGGDRALLAGNPEAAAQGIADGVMCFLESRWELEER